MTSYRAPFPYRERQGSREELDHMPQRRDFDDEYYGHSHARYRRDPGHPLYNEDEGYLEDERREYIDYRDRKPDLRDKVDEYRRFERESRKPSPPPPPRDFRRNEESPRDLDPDMSRESRFFDSLDEYIREQRELNHADVNREKQRVPRSLLDLEPKILNDDRSRDHSEGGGYRSRDRDYRSRHDNDDYHRSDYNDDYGCRRYERRPRMKEPDYHDNVDPRHHGYHRDHARSDPYYQRDDRNDYDKRSEDILYGYRDRHRRCTERDLRKQMDEYDSHGRGNSSERERGRRGREFSFVDREKHSYSSSSRLLQDERTTRPGMRSYDDDPQRGTERVEPRCKRERRLSREDYQRVSRHSQPQRSGRLSRSPGIPIKVHSRSSSPARKSPLTSGKTQTHDKNPKRKMPVNELNETKRRKCDGRLTNTSPKSESPKAGLITRDQFLSRDVFHSIKHSNREPEGKRTRSSDIEFRDSNLSRSSCGERDLRHELSVSRAAAASEAKSLNFGNSSDYEERSSTASSTRIIDSEPSSIRSIVQIPTKKFQVVQESRTKVKEEVENHATQIRRSITPDPVIKTRIKQVSALPKAEPLPVTTGQSVKTSEVLKRKVSICSGRATSPLLGVVEKPKVELPADDLRLLIMSRRLRQNEESPSLDENLVEKTEEPLMSSPRTDHCQFSSERQGSTDRMVELSYSDPEASANEDSAPPTPTGHACRKVVMRREVILDYDHLRSHPKTLHRSLDKDKEKEKLDKENKKSGNSNVVVEVVSEGMANLPVCTNRPLFKEGNENLSTVEVVDNSFESLNSHAANDSQRSEESTKDVNSYEVEQCSYGNAIADGANSTAVYEEESNYPQQTEERVSDQQILDYDTSVGKYQGTKVDGVQESERLKEENNVWMGSSEHCENEQQIWPHEENSYQDLGHFQEENDDAGENLPEHYQEEQHSGSYLEQDCYQKWHNTETSEDARENTAESYEEEQQSVSHYEQEYSQGLRYDGEANDVLRKNPSEYYEDEAHQSVSHYEQEYSQEHGYHAEGSDVVRENTAEHHEEEQPLSHYDQEYSQELGYNAEESDVVRENPSEHYEEQPLSHYDQEYSQELGHYTEESDVVRQNTAEHHEEEQPLSHYDQEYSQELGYNAEESDVVRENPSEHYEEQPLSHYDQEYSQELGHYTEESDMVRQNTAEHHEEGDVVRENPSESYEEEQHIPSYEQQSYQELEHYTEESDVVRKNTSEHYENEPQISHYEQECYQKLEHFVQESDAVRQDLSQHYEEEQSVLHYDEECPQELGHYKKESDVVRENTSEHYEEDQPVPYDEQLSYRELGHYTKESDVARENTSQHYEEDQPLPYHEQQSYWEHGPESSQEIEYLPEEVANNIRNNCSEFYQEDQPVFRSEAEFSQEVDHLPENTTDEKRERSLEPHKDEQQDSKKEYFQEFKQFSGTRDDANDHESLSEPSEQESEPSEQESDSSEYETASQNGEEDESFSSEGESYQTTTDEDNYYKVNDLGVVNFTEKKHELSDSSERQYGYYGDPMSEAAFSEVKPSCSSEYNPVTISHQYKPESSKNVEEYENYDDFEEDTPEMSNGYDVILALDSFDNDDTDDGIKYAKNSDFDNGGILGQDGIDGTGYLQGGRKMTEVHGFSYKMDAPKLQGSDDDKHDVIGTTITEMEDKGRVAKNNEHAENIGKAELTHIIGTDDQNSEAGNEATSIDKDRSSCECVKKISPEDVPAIGTEDFYHTVGQPIEDFAEDEKYQGSDECPIRHYDLSRPHCNNEENELQKLKHCDLNRSSGSEYDPARPTKEYGTMNEQISCCHSDNDELEEPNTSADLLNRTSGSEYDPARPTKDHGIMNEKNSCCHSDNDELQEPTTSADLLNKSSGSEYDPARPTKDYLNTNDQNRYADGEDDVQSVTHSQDIFNKSIGSDHEYDMPLPTKDYGIIRAQTRYDDDDEKEEQEEADDDHYEGMQQSIHSEDILNTSSGAEYDMPLPTKGYGIIRAQTRYDDEEEEEEEKEEVQEEVQEEVDDYHHEGMQQLSHFADVLNKSSGSEYDPSLPTKDYGIIKAQTSCDDDDKGMQQSNHSEDILNTSSGAECDMPLPTKDYGIIRTQTSYDNDDEEEEKEQEREEADNDHHEGMQQSSHFVDVLNKSSGSEYDPSLPTKDYVQSLQVSHVSDDIQELRHLDLNKSSVSETDVHILTEVCDLTNEQDYHNDDVNQDLRHPDLNKSSGSEYDPYIPTRGFDITFEQNSHDDDDVVQELRHPNVNKSSVSETDVPTKDGDVTFEQDNHSDEVIQELHSPALNKSSVSEYDPHIPTRDCDVTFEQDNHGDDVIQEFRSSDLNKSSASEYDPHIPTRDYDVTFEQDNHSDDVIQDLRSPDLSSSCGMETDVPLPTKSCDVSNEQKRYDVEVIQELRHPNLNESDVTIGSEYDPHLQSRDSDDISDVKKVMEDAGSTCTVAEIEERYNGGQSLPESDEMLVEHEATDTQECIIVMCDNYATSGNAHPSYEMVQEEYRVHGAATEVFLPLDVNASHICIYECVDFQLQRVLCQTSTTGDQGTSHNLEADVSGCQEDLATAHITSARNMRATNSAVAAPIVREECIIEERRVGQNQGNLICAPVSDEDQACLPEESSCTRLNVVTSNAQVTQGNMTQQSVPESECNLAEHGDLDEEENPEVIIGIILVQNNVGMSDDSCTSTGIPLIEMSTENNEKETTQDLVTDSDATKVDRGLFECMAASTGFSEELCRESESFCSSALVENVQKNRGFYDIEIKLESDDPDLMYTDEVQYFEGEQPVGQSEISGTPESSNQSISSGENMMSDDDACSKESCDSSDYDTRGKHWYSSDTSLSGDDGNTSKNSKISDTRKLVCSVEDQQTKTVAGNGSTCISISDTSDYIVNEEHDEHIPSQETLVSISSELSDSVGVSTSRLGVEYCEKKSPRQRQSEMMLKLREEFRKCSQNDGQQGCDYLVSSSSQTSYSVLSDSHDSALQAKPYDPECASLTQVSLSDVSMGIPSASSAHGVCVTDQQDLFSDMSLESSSQTSPRTQAVNSPLRASINQSSPSDISLAFPSTILGVPNEHEDSDLKSRKIYDPANCFMDVDTFSELSGMSLDTPSSSTVEYTAEADNTLVWLADDDSEPYTPQAYSRSPENDSEPYTPKAYSPVLSLSGDESDPELFSCKYMDNSSAPYNPESHCPLDLNMSSISGNEADNEVSTGISSPELSSNRKIPLSLRLKKKPGSKKVHLQSYVGYSSLDKESSTDDAWQKNPEAYSPENFVPLSKPAAARKNSSKKSLRVHSRSKIDDVERRKRVNTPTKSKESSVENKKPHASQKSLPSSSEKSETTRGKECKSREEHTTGSKRKPLKSLVTLVTPCTNKRAKEDEGRKKIPHNTSTRVNEKSGTKDHKSSPKEKESAKRRAVSETNEAETAQEKSTPPLKKSKLSSPSSTKRSSPKSSGTGTSHQNKNMPSARRNSREEKFKKPVNPARTETGKKSSERTKESSQKKTVRSGSAAKRKVQEGASTADGSFTVLNELKSIMNDIHRKSPKSSNKPPESSAGTKNTEKAEETVDEIHLLDEGHELLELALEESINRTKSDKATRVSSSDNNKDSAKPGSHEKTISLNLAEKVDKMKRKLAEAKEISGNENTNLTKGLKPSEVQETRVNITISNDLDNSADDKGSKNAVKAKNEEMLDTLKANQTSAVRSINDKFESIKLAVKCNGDEKDAINNSVVTGSKINDKELEIENTMVVAPHEKKNEDKNSNPDDNIGRITMVDNGVEANENVVSAAIEKQEGSKTEMYSATDIEPCPTGVQETIDEPIEEDIVRSGTEIQKNKQDAQGSDEENRCSTSGNLDTRKSVETGDEIRKNKQDVQGSDEENHSSTSVNLDTRKSVETGESFAVDKVSSVIGNLKGDENLECIIEDAVAESLTNETTSEAFDVSPMESTINEDNIEKEKNICTEDGQDTPGEDTCKSDLEVTNTLSPAFSVILSPTMKAHGQDKYSHEVRGQDSKMSGGQIPEDKTGKTVISESGALENDHLSKDQDGQPNKRRKGNENDEFDQYKNNWPKDTQPNKEKQDAEKNEFDEEKNDWSTIKGNVESNSYTATTLQKASATKVQTRANSPLTPNGSPCTQIIQTAANDSATPTGKASIPKVVKIKASSPPTPSESPCTQVVQTTANDSDTPSGKASTPKAVQIRANGPPTPSGVPCTQVVQTAANDSDTPSGQASTSKAVQIRANGPPTPSGVPCTQVVQTAANDSATSSGQASTPKVVQIRANGPPTPSGSPCIQVVQTAANDSVISGGTLCTPKDQTGANNIDTKNSKSKEEEEDSREAVSSILAEPIKNQKDSKAEDNKASDVTVTSSGQPKEEEKDVKSEISLEEYIEAQLQHGLSLPDISVNSGPSSKVSSEILPSLPSLSFTNPAVAPGTSKINSLSPLKVPLVAVASSSAMESQKKHLSPTISSNNERETCMLSGDVSKESPLVNESKCQVPSKREEGSSKQGKSGMDIVRSLRSEYERKIIAILQKRVDVEKAYREECTSIVNAVKALARKKKNMERELQEVLQSSLREISQKYVSELQLFVRNETI